MPAHKRKKSKKSHKRQTKGDSTSLHKIIWKEILPQSDSDSSENEDKLTYLVRRSYRNHVQESLIQNFKMCINSSTKLTSASVEDMVEKWSSALEKKALKACMIKDQYRKNMVSLIKHIKSATDDKRLCFEEQSVNNLISRLPSNKKTQTESTSPDPKMVTSETQTDCTITSFLKQNWSNTLKSDTYDSATDLPNIAFVSSSQTWETSDYKQDVCSITSTSDLYPPELTNNSNNIKDNTQNKPSPTPISVDLNKNKYDNKSSTKTFVDKRHCLETNKSSGTSDKTLEPIRYCSEHLQEHLFTDLRHVGPNACEMNTLGDSLEFNISVMESLNDIDSENNLDQLTPWKYKKCNWYAEETAQMCNLTRLLLQMPTSRRERVINKIKELFGDTELSLAELTAQNITICRKRIASAVVMELTPMYKSKRIASRKLFKYLAKKITKSILEESYAPDSRDVRWKVKQFFSGGKVITNESDCT